MHKTWQYLVNPFLNATRSSFTLAQTINNYHYIALKGKLDDPYFKAMYEVYLPLHDTYENLFTKWKAKQQSQTGQTDSVVKLLDDLSDKYDDWELEIRRFHKKESSEYKALLGSGKGVFTKGTQVSRIAAVKALAENLKDREPLKTAKEDIDNFILKLTAAHENKDSAKKDTGNHSDELENARIAICIQQYIHLGMLIAKFASNPESIENYFDTAHIRNLDNGSKDDEDDSEGSNPPAQ